MAGLTALHTPGHAADHLCFARADGVIFTADHVMTWSTSVVSPPAGDMAAYIARCAGCWRATTACCCPATARRWPSRAPICAFLLAHREQREAAVLAAIAAAPRTPAALVEILYAPVDPRLRGAAERNVLAHLLKLQAEGRAEPQDGAWRAA